VQRRHAAGLANRAGMRAHSDWLVSPPPAPILALAIFFLCTAPVTEAFFGCTVAKNIQNHPCRHTPVFLLGDANAPNVDDGATAEKDDDGECFVDESYTSLTRRSALSRAAMAVAVGANALTSSAQRAQAEITPESTWPLWPALPVAPYSRRKTLRRQVGPGVWTFDQLIGIYYVHVPIRMTVVAMQKSRGLLVYAPVAPTRECLRLLQDIIDEHGPVRYIILPSVAVEHKVNAGPFARAFPEADFYATDRQYSFPVPLPQEFLGLPRWTKPLPPSSSEGTGEGMWEGEFEHEVLTVKPGPGSMYQDVAMFHKPSKTLLICDAVFAASDEPPPILMEEPEYTRALLFHARDSKDEVVPDTPENRRKGWRRIVLLFNFFFPGAGRANLGLGPVLDALRNPGYPYGWGGWMPFSWNGNSEVRSFNAYSAGGKPTMYTIIQIILSRGPEEVQKWLDRVTRWDFERVVPAHLDAPLSIGPSQLTEVFQFAKTGRNEVRFCDEDVAFLRQAEEGFLNFSVYKTSLGTLRGKDSTCGLTRPP